MKVALLFDNFGPYHWARARAAAGVCDLLTIEFGRSSSTYVWRNEQSQDSRHLTLNPDGTSSAISRSNLWERLWGGLDQFSPDAVLVPGWSSREALLSLDWCCRTGTPAVLMSESTLGDAPRTFVGETPKRRLIRFYSAALVGGTPHRDYVSQLGMASDRVFTGYNAVDNEYFTEKTQDYKKQDARKEERRQEADSSSQLSAFKFSAFAPKCFLASNRFIDRKNLSRLIEGYGAYLKSCRLSVVGCQSEEVDGASPWNLCLLGDGELKPDLIAKCHELRLSVKESAPWESTKDLGPRTKDAPQAQSTVFFPGFRQIDELPRFYAHAGCFIHPALTEPWGLVVNEAMACGLPILVSERAGCAQDLVQDGVNGFTFDPVDVGQICDLMRTVAADDFPRNAYGAASRRIVDNYGPAAFAAGLEAAARKAMEVGPARPSFFDRLLLEVLCRIR